MNIELLRLATGRLAIKDILLNSSYIKTNENFCPQESKPYEIQFKHYPVDSNTFDLLDENKQINLIRFRYLAGFRVLPEGLTDEEKMSDASDKVEAEVIATFSAIYTLTEEIPSEAIKEFSEHNLGYNVWPYWREYASSTATRLGLPQFSIPLYRLPT